MSVRVPACLFSLLLLFVSSTLDAQQGDRNIISHTSRDGRIRFLKIQPLANAGIRTDTSIQSIKKLLKLGNRYNLVNDRTEESNISHSQRHSRYDQYFNGIKVEFGVLNIQSENGSLKSIAGEYFNLPDNFITQPVLSESSALQQAISFMGAKKYSWEDPNFTHKEVKGKPKGKLVIVKDFDKNKREDSVPTMRLAYKFALYALEPLRYDYIYVDASNGKILLDNPIIKHLDAPADTRYSGTRNIATSTGVNGNYLLKDSGNIYRIATYNLNKGTAYETAPLFSDGDNNWSSSEYNNSSFDNAALDAHWGAMMTMDYWRTVHNRNSYDDQGGMIRSYVHYSTGYVNAFWDGYVMTYGDGNGTTNFPLTTVDICGHEIGHAVCQYTANLVYSGESGALNESFSDIWGACIKRFAAPEKNTWLMGDEISTSGTPFRSFSNPNTYGQPDTYKGTYWYDGADVHTNSGVQNHWFYILTEGKSGTNDLGYNYNVTGIGITNAAKIAYRAESVYLFPSANYADARNASLQAAEDLFGVNSNEVIQTAEAWNAVGVYEQLMIPSNLTASLNTNNQGILNWSFLTSQNITGFLVEKSVSGNGYVQIASIGPAERTYLDSNVDNDAISGYRLKAVKNGVYSNYTNTAFVSRGNAPYVMQPGNKTACGFTFLDPGGFDKYPNYSNLTTTFSPVGAGNKIKVVFSKFKTENNYDYLAVYNGPSTAYPLLGQYSGSNLPPILESSAASGELTFAFSSSGQNADSGWVALVSCTKPVNAPTSLSVGVVNQLQVNLSWNDNAADETEYVLERSINDSMHFAPLVDLSPNTISYNDTPNVNGQVFYRVYALRDTMKSKTSNVVSVGVGNIFTMRNASISTCETIFLDPGGFGNNSSAGTYTATISPAVPGNRLRLIFSQFLLPTCCDYLNIYNGPSTTSPIIGSYVGSNIPATIESTSPNGELTFVFYSNTYNPYPGWQATITCFKPVLAPSNLSSSVSNQKFVNLSWTDNSQDETAFSIQKSVNDSLHFSTIVNLPSNSTSFTDTANENGRVFYRLIAYRDSMASKPSNTIDAVVGNVFILQSGTYNNCGSVFLDPGGYANYPGQNFYSTTFAPTEPGKKIKVAFSQFQLANLYDQLQIFNGPSVNSPLLGTYRLNNMPPSFESTAPNGELTFALSANSGNAPGWIGYISCYKPVSKPTGLTIQPGAAIVELKWTDNANDEEKYIIERSVNAVSKYVPLVELGPNSVSYIDTNAILNNIYYYRIRAVRDTISSIPSDTARIDFGNAPFLMTDSVLVTCDKVFMDPGGADVFSSEPRVITTTIKPAIAGNRIKVRFTKFRGSQTILFIYNGSTVNSPLLGSYSSNNLPNTFEGTSAEGSLTFKWSNSGNSDSGWLAQINCYKPVPRPTSLSIALDINEKPKLTWTDNADDETKFIIERSINAPSLYQYLAEVPANTLNYWDTSAPYNSVLFYRIKAVRDTVSSFYSDTAKVPVGNAPFLMQNSTVVTCDKIFLDPGGIDLYPFTFYNIATTFKPATPGYSIRVNFSKLSINNAGLTAFNGPTINSPVLRSDTPPNALPVYTSTSADGSMTFRFANAVNGFGTADSGWVAHVTCYKFVARPTVLTAVMDSTNRVRLNWIDNANNETSYFVERSINCWTKFRVIGQSPANSSSYIDSSAPTNSQLFYRIRTFSDTTASLFSDTSRIDLGNAPFIMKDSVVVSCEKVFLDPGGDDVYPPPPYNSSKVTTTFRPDVSGNRVRVSFSKFRLAGGVLTVFDGASSSANVIGSYINTNLPPTLEGREMGALTFEFSPSYTLDSGWVAQVSCYKPVSSPTNLTSTLDSLKRIRLTWNDNATDETKFVIEKSINDSLHFTLWKELPLNTTSYLDSASPSSYDIYYRVRSMKNEEVSLPSNSVLGYKFPSLYMGNGTFPVCGIVFFDPGGQSNYSDNSDYTATLRPSVPGNQIRVAFTSFATESCCDYLSVYDGPSTAYPLLGTFKGNTLPPILQSTAPNGELTFHFVSNGSVVDRGWTADVSCITVGPNQCNWTGSLNNDWANPQNWTCGRVPDPYTDVIIEAGKLMYPIISADINIRSLTIQTGARVEVSYGVKVNISH
jgi:Zn-dependent metalloprotease